MKQLLTACALASLFAVLQGCTHTKQGYLEKGNQFFRSGKYAEAALNYRKAIQKDPQFGEAFYRLGLTAIKQDDARVTYNALFRAVELQPDNVNAKEKFGDVCLTAFMADPSRPANLYMQITRLSDELLARDANSYEGLRLKGYLATTDHRLKEAIALFRRAIQVKPGNVVLETSLVQALLQDGQQQEGEKLASDLMARTRQDPIFALMYSWYYNSNRIALAEEVRKTRVTRNPKDGLAILDLARHYARVQNSSEMKSTLQRLLDNPKDFPQARMAVGDFYIGLLFFPEAVANYEEGIRIHPESRILFQKRITNALIGEGKKDQAAELVEQILKEQPKDDEALQVRAALWLESGKPQTVEAASHEFQALLTQHSGDPNLWYKAGLANRLTGNPEAARTQFLEAVKRRPNFVPPRYELAEISLSQQKPHETLQFATEILAVQPNDLRGRVLHAVGLMETGNLGLARAELTKVIKESPKYANAQVQLGILALREKRYQEALEIFAKLRGGGDARGVAGLAATYSSQNEMSKAFQVLEDTLAKAPASSLLHGQLANVAAMNGQYDLAIGEFRKVLSLDPRSILQRLRLGEVYELKGDYKGAIAVYREAQGLSPQDPVSTLSLAGALAKAGRPQEARAQYRSILNSNPNHPAALNDLAYLLSETGGNLDEALSLAQRAVEATPGQPSFVDTMGYIYLKKGMRDSALQTFGNLVRKYPKYPTFRYHLAIALFEKGDKTGARKELETALANHPSREVAVKIKELVGRTQS